MLHERTAPLVRHDAVAVRDESDTLVLYAERLTASQRAGLRPYLLEALEQEEGAAAVVVVPAGATARVLASPPNTVAPLGVVGALVATLAVVLIAAAFVAAVIVLVVDEVKVTDRVDSGRAPRTLAVDRDPGGEGIVGRGEMIGEPPPPPPSRLPREEALSVPEGRRPEVGLLVDVPGTVRRIVPDAVAVVTSVVPGDVVDDVAADALESPSPIDLPELRLSDVEVPDVEPPVDLPDVDLSGVSLDVSDETGEDGEETEGGDGSEDDSEDEDDEESGDADDAVPDLGSDEDDDE